MERILILVNHDVAIYNFRLELVERLIADGYEVHISSPVGEHTEDLKVLGTYFHEIDIDRHGMNPITDFAIIKEYRRLMKSIRPKMVFTYTVKCNVYGGLVARSLRIPFCANITGLGTTLNNDGVKSRIVLTLYRLGLKGAQRVFFQNESNKEFMIKNKVISSPYTVLPGSGVNLERQCYEPYPDTENPIVISYIGRIMKDKGIDELLEAAECVKKKHAEVIFRLIGFFDGDYEERIKKAERDGVIEYIEQQRDVHACMKNSHAIILPSYHEGMSNVLLEAAATGRPVLASNIPGCRETFEEAVSGFGFNVKDAEDIIRVIEMFLRLTHDQKANMGYEGRKKAEREFDRRIVVDRYMEELLG